MDIKKIVGLVSMVLMSIIDAAAGMGIHLPTGVDAQGVLLLNGVAFAVNAAVLHFMGKDAAPADPAA